MGAKGSPAFTSSAANFRTAVNGVFSGTLNLRTADQALPNLTRNLYTLNGSFGSEVRVILKVTFALLTVDDAAVGAVLEAI